MLTNGSGYAVYEVADANPAVQESAQFPTFISLPRFTAPTTAQETVAMAPLSTVNTASQTAPLPRFTAVTVQSDCNLFGDCAAPVVIPPKLLLQASPIVITAVAGGGAMTSKPGTFAIHNEGAGTLTWTTSVVYTQATGWLVLDTPSGTGDATVQVTASTKTLTAGLYLATIIANGGAAGSQSVPSDSHGDRRRAHAAAPYTDGGRHSGIECRHLSAVAAGPRLARHADGHALLRQERGRDLRWRVRDLALFRRHADQSPGARASLGAKTSASVVVTVDGVSSAPVMAPLTAAWPAVFPHGVLNQDNSENTYSSVAKSGDILQIFATGIPKLATVSAQIADRKDLIPVYAGDAPGFAGRATGKRRRPARCHRSGRTWKCAQPPEASRICSPAYTITVQ